MTTEGIERSAFFVVHIAFVWTQFYVFIDIGDTLLKVAQFAIDQIAVEIRIFVFRIELGTTIDVFIGGRQFRQSANRLYVGRWHSGQ